MRRAAEKIKYQKFLMCLGFLIVFYAINCELQKDVREEVEIVKKLKENS